MRTTRTHLAVTPMDRSAPRRPGFRALTAAGIALAAFGPLGRTSREAGASTPTTVGEGTTTDRTCLRSGPGPLCAVLRTVPAGEEIQVSNTVRDGFRYVVHRGVPGWMDEGALAWPS